MREGETLRKGRRQVYQRREREELFRACYSGVLAFVLSQVDGLERAKAITADAFAAVLQDEPSSPTPIEPRVALFTYARLAVDADRKSARTAPPVPGPAAFRGPPHLRRIEACVRRLGPSEQGVISLRFDAALSCREIGLVMGMNEVEVMVTVLRSLRRIKACMDAGSGRTASDVRKPAKPAPG
jgi:DNA-directed RNA polymerase specialized sigma24 family protein